MHDAVNHPAHYTDGPPCPKCGSYSLVECGTWPFKRIVCFWIECDHEMKSWPPVSVPLKQQEMT